MNLEECDWFTRGLVWLVWVVVIMSVSQYPQYLFFQHYFTAGNNRSRSLHLFFTHPECFHVVLFSVVSFCFSLSFSKCLSQSFGLLLAQLNQHSPSQSYPFSLCFSAWLQHTHSHILASDFVACFSLILGRHTQ